MESSEHGEKRHDITGSADGTIVFVGPQEYDLFYAGLVHDSFRDIVDLPETKNIAVDLQETDFLDCAGLRSLISIRNDALESGKEFSVRNVHGIARRVIELTGTAPILNIEGFPAQTDLT